MRRAHVNTATFAGRVCEMSTLQEDPLGRPLLQFSLDTRYNLELADALSVSEKHRCVAGDALAEELSQTVRNGATLLVHGPLFVNSRAKKSLGRRIATLPVEHATLLREPRQPGAEGAGLEETNTRGLKLAENEVHLVGTVVSVVPDALADARLTISTRLPFPAIHEVLVWLTTDFAAPVGATVEVRGMLAQHVVPWPDGQVRQMSIVECEDVQVFDNAHRARTSLPRVRASDGVERALLGIT